MGDSSHRHAALSERSALYLVIGKQRVSHYLPFPIKLMMCDLVPPSQFGYHFDTLRVTTGITGIVASQCLWTPSPSTSHHNHCHRTLQILLREVGANATPTSCPGLITFA